MSSILDSILGGGASAGGDPSQGGGLPPDIMSAIQSQGGQDASAGDDSSNDPVAALDDALTALQTYMGVEPDEADKAIVATCIASLQKVKAKDQQEADGALQGKTTPRLIRKAMGGQGSDTSGGSGY